MNIELFASAIGIVISIVTTTLVVVAKITKLEIMLAELRASMGGFEHRIAALERKSERL